MASFRKILLLAVVSRAAANLVPAPVPATSQIQDRKQEIYKGVQSVKVGRKKYKCTLNIAYTTSPPACGKRSAKCKPGSKKPIKVPPIQLKDATITVTVAKNKVTHCKVDPLQTSTIPPTLGPESTIPPTLGPESTNPATPGPDSSSQLNCSCRNPLPELPSSRLVSFAQMLVTANSRTGLGRGRVCSAPDGRLDRRVPIAALSAIFKGGTFQFIANIVVTIIGLIFIPIIGMFTGDRSLHPAFKSMERQDFSHILKLLNMENKEGFTHEELIANIFKNRMFGIKAKERNEKLQTNRAFFTPLLLILSIIITPIFSLLFGSSRSLQLKDVEEKERWEARILSLILQDDANRIFGLGSSSSSSSSSSEESEESGENGGTLGGVLGGAITAQVVETMIEEILGRGNLETDINKIIVRSWILAYKDDTKKVGELTTIGMDNGIEKQYIKGLIETGDIETLTNELMDKGAGTEVINKAVEDLENDFPGEFAEAEEQIMNTDINMQCSCYKNE